jgi:hypothetical protein
VRKEKKASLSAGLGSDWSAVLDHLGLVMEIAMALGQDMEAMGYRGGLPTKDIPEILELARESEALVRSEEANLAAAEVSTLRGGHLDRSFSECAFHPPIGRLKRIAFVNGHMFL